MEPALLDSSAWARLQHRSLGLRRRTEIAEAIAEGKIFISLPLLLEAGYSGGTARDHDELFGVLLDLPWAEIDATVERRAVQAQEQLAQAGLRRLPPVDLLMAALADRHRLALLHYDGDYDVIVRNTDLRFASTWLARHGSL